MEKIKLNHWFAGDNELVISLMRYAVKIRVMQNEDTIYYHLEVYEYSDNADLILNFYSLSDAISFTENVVQVGYNIEDIIEKYLEKGQNGELTSYTDIKDRSR